MSPHTRRSLLRSIGVATAVGVAGCSNDGGGPSGTATGTSVDGPTFGIEVDNQLTEQLFENTHDISPKPAVVDVTVRDTEPDSETVYFERRFEVATGGAKTVDDAFTAERDGTTYAVNATMEPFTEDGISQQRDRRAGLSFNPGEFGTPSNPIPIRVVNDTDLDVLYPALAVGEASEN